MKKILMLLSLIGLSFAVTVEPSRPNTFNRTTVTVSKNSVQIIAKDPYRQYLRITNTSSKEVWIAFDQTAVSANGILLSPKYSEGYYYETTGINVPDAKVNAKSMYGGEVLAIETFRRK